MKINEIYKGDCLELMPKHVEDKCIDAIICDLPYGTTACKWDAIIPFDELWREYKRVIKDNGTIILFGSEPFSSLLRTSNLDWYKYDWIWEKNNAGNFQLANHQPLKVHETISIFYNNSAFLNIMKSNMERLNLKKIDISKLQLSKNGNLTGWVTNKLNGSQIPTKEQWAKICSLFEIYDDYDELLVTYNKDLKKTNVILSNKNKGGLLGHLSSENKRKTYTQTKTGYPKSILKYSREVGHHPTQKPLSLIEYLIRTYTNEGDLILDNTCGSGTTGLGAKNLNRNYIMMEQDAKYYDIACKRVQS